MIDQPGAEGGTPERAGRRDVQGRPDPPGSTDTAELRWFARGPLPPEVHAWFTGPVAATESRGDRYLLGPDPGVGIKVRGGHILELKVRSGVGHREDLARGLGGRVEHWRKWSPADDVVSLPGDARWISVGKVITKRRFSRAGAELVVADDAPEAGCDVEVARVTVGSLDAWTFAFAAFGPRAGHREALHAAWRSLAGSAPPPVALVQDLGRSMGYPTWLARAVAVDTPAHDAVCPSGRVGHEPPGGHASSAQSCDP